MMMKIPGSIVFLCRDAHLSNLRVVRKAKATGEPKAIPYGSAAFAAVPQRTPLKKLVYTSVTYAVTVKRAYAGKGGVQVLFDGEIQTRNVARPQLVFRPPQQ
jgi:hypothetical protein